MKYFVTGASGFLGTHLVRQLVAASHEVVALVYEPERESVVAALGAQTVVGGFDGELLKNAMAGCDGIFHVAGLVSLRKRDAKRSRQVNVEGTRTVLVAAQAAGIQRVVHTSTLAAIGATLEGVILNEDSPFNLDGLKLAYIQTKREGEQLALSFNSDALQVVVCNPPGIIGPQDLWGTQANVIFDLYLKSAVRIVPDVRNNWGDVRDVARGHILAMERGTPGQRYFIGTINTTIKDLMSRLDQTRGRKPRWRLQLKWPGTFFVGCLSSLFSRNPPITPGLAKFMRYAFWFSSDKAKSELGFAGRPIEDTLADTLDWFRHREQTPSVPPQETDSHDATNVVPNQS